MEVATDTLFLSPGSSTFVRVLVQPASPHDVVSVRCTSDVAGMIPTIVQCPQLDTISSQGPAMPIPISISREAKPGILDIQLVGRSASEEQTLTLHIHISERAVLGTMANGDSLVSEPSWKRELGTQGTDQISSIAQGLDGEVYLAGQTTGGFFSQQNEGDFDVFVIRYTKDGRVDWLSQIGSKRSDVISAIAVDPNGQLVVVGYTYDALPMQRSQGRADIFVAKYFSNGRLAWVTQFGTKEIDKGTGLSIDKDGSIFVTGTTEGVLSGVASQGGVDPFLSKLSSDGTVAWTKQFGTTEDDTALAIQVLPDGRIGLGGATFGAFPNQTHQGQSDSWIGMFQPDGSPLWITQFGTPKMDTITSLTSGENSVLYAAGNTAGVLSEGYNLGGQDGFFVRVDEMGQRSRVIQLGTPYTDEVRSIAFFQGMLLLLGSTKSDFVGNLIGKSDAFVVMFSTGGDQLGGTQFGTTDEDSAASMSVSKDKLYVAGTTFGIFPDCFNAGDSDGFIQAFDLTQLPRQP